MGNGEVPQKRGRASIQWSNWLKFTQEFVTVSGVVEFLVQFKAGFPALIEALPELVDMLAASEEIPKEKIDELRAKAKKVSDADWKGGPIFERFLLEMLASRMAEAFELHLTQLLAHMLRKYPGALGDSQVQVHDLLECRDVNEAIDRAIEKKVRDLSFGGLSDIATFFDKQFSVSVDRGSASFRVVAELIEVRHLIAHNGGCVDHRFLSKTKRSDLGLGEPFPITIHWVIGAMKSLGQLVSQLERQVVSRLKV